MATVMTTFCTHEIIHVMKAIRTMKILTYIIAAIKFIKEDEELCAKVIEEIRESAKKKQHKCFSDTFLSKLNLIHKQTSFQHTRLQSIIRKKFNQIVASKPWAKALSKKNFENLVRTQITFFEDIDTAFFGCFLV